MFMSCSNMHLSFSLSAGLLLSWIRIYITYDLCIIVLLVLSCLVLSIVGMCQWFETLESSQFLILYFNSMACQIPIFNDLISNTPSLPVSCTGSRVTAYGVLHTVYNRIHKLLLVHFSLCM